MKLGCCSLQRLIDRRTIKMYRVFQNKMEERENKSFVVGGVFKYKLSYLKAKNLNGVLKVLRKTPKCLELHIHINFIRRE